MTVPVVAPERPRDAMLRIMLTRREPGPPAGWHRKVSADWHASPWRLQTEKKRRHVRCYNVDICVLRSKGA